MSKAPTEIERLEKLAQYETAIARGKKTSGVVAELVSVRVSFNRGASYHALAVCETCRSIFHEKGLIYHTLPNNWNLAACEHCGALNGAQ